MLSNQSDRNAPWGGAQTPKAKPMRPSWDGPHRFCTDHGVYKIYVRTNETAYAAYIPAGQVELFAIDIDDAGLPARPGTTFLFPSEKEATAAIKKHHQRTLRALRTAKAKESS